MEDENEFDAGGIYAPYDYTRSRSTSVESGEIKESDSECEDAAAKPITKKTADNASEVRRRHQPETFAVLAPGPRRQPETFSSILFVRVRSAKLRTGPVEWFEFLMERKGQDAASGCYQFPQIGGKELEPLVARLTQRRMLRGDVPATFRSHYVTSVTCGRTTMNVFMLPMEKTQQPRTRDRKLIAPPNLYWMCESQLATHGDVGPPGAFGLLMAPWSLETFYTLHPSMRYASPAPPLVLYHGTDDKAVLDIAATGLKPAPRKDAMLGPGVYFGRWDKARDFATHDAGNDARAVPGVIIRCIVFTGPTLTMASTMICSCGCAKPYVDHSGDHSRGFTTVYIPDNSYGATKRAEWCVKEPDVILVEGIFSP